MTKQEIMEDIKDHILTAWDDCDAMGCNDCKYSEITNISQCQAIFVAEKLYNAGYRKVGD